MPRGQRILMVLDESFPPDARVENEALSLIEAGFDVSLLAVAQDDRPKRETYRGLQIFRDRIPTQLRNKMRGLVSTIPVYNWYLDRRIRQVYRTWPFDALHVHDLHLFGGGLRAGHRLDVPVVGDLHENWVEALKHYAWSTRPPGKYLVSIPRWERLEKQWVREVDHLVVVIEEAAVRNRELGVPPERITIVPNTIRRATFEGFEEDPALIDRIRSDFTITYTGGMDVHRGLSSVVEAMPRVLAVHPGARLVLVGEGRIRAELEALVGRLGIAGQVRFEGWQPQALLKSYILASDVCLVPHLKTAHTDATIPHKLFHYMYLQRPVVVSNCRPLERIVQEAEAGLVYPAGDAQALAEALLYVRAHPEEARTMGRRGQEAVVEQYNWEATVQGLVEMYRALL